MNVQATHTTVDVSHGVSGVYRVDAAAPFRWLASGFRNFKAAPLASGLYGLLFSSFVAGTLYLSWEFPGFTVAFLTGLLLIGPLLAAGVYVAARQQEIGQYTSIPEAFALLRSRGTNLALFGAFLSLIMVAWLRASALLLALKFGTFEITTSGYLGMLSGSGDPVALAYFLLIGMALATVVFVTSAVAIPMIVHRDCNPVTAIHTSARAVARNWPAMMLWAALIVVLTVVGMASLLIGLVVIFPVLGYATWHSYRDLVP